MLGLAKEGMENFVKAQKQFLDLIAEETAKATSGRHFNGAAKKEKKEELTELARQATKSFIDAQKKLADVAGNQLTEHGEQLRANRLNCCGHFLLCRSPI